MYNNILATHISIETNSGLTLYRVPWVWWSSSHWETEVSTVTTVFNGCDLCTGLVELMWEQWVEVLSVFAGALLVTRLQYIYVSECFFRVNVFKFLKCTCGDIFNDVDTYSNHFAPQAPVPTFCPYVYMYMYLVCNSRDHLYTYMYLYMCLP